MVEVSEGENNYLLQVVVMFDYFHSRHGKIDPVAS